MTFIRKPASPAAFDYRIAEDIAVISQNEKGAYTLRLTKTSFNGKPVKLDIRHWQNFENPERRQMQKGVQLCEEEARELLTALQNYFEEAGAVE